MIDVDPQRTSGAPKRAATPCPLNLTREAIGKKPSTQWLSGTLPISDVDEPALLLRGPLAEYEAWLSKVLKPNDAPFGEPMEKQ